MNSSGDAVDLYAEACEALRAAQDFYDANAHRMDDGPRATAMAALVTARFAKVSAAASLFHAAGGIPR